MYTENETAPIGLVDLSLCLDTVAKVCPELCEFSEYSDFSVYSVDYSEEERPLLAHGLLSLHLERDSQSAGQFLAGRICRTTLYTQVLEVELSFTPLLKRKIAALQDAYEPSMPPPLPLSEEMPVAQAMKSMPVSFDTPQKYSSLREQLPILPSYRHPAVPASSSTRVASDATTVPSSDAALTGIKRISPSKRFAASLFIPPSSPPRGLSGPHCPPQPMLVNNTANQPRYQRRGDKIDEQLTQALVMGQEPDFCFNCGDIRTSTWRKVEIDGKEHNLCNACGLYYRAKKVMRPKELFSRKSRMSKNSNPDSRGSRRTPPIQQIVESRRALASTDLRLIKATSSSDATPQSHNGDASEEQATPADGSPPAGSGSSSEPDLPNDETTSRPAPSSPSAPKITSSSSDPEMPSTPDLDGNKENIPPDVRRVLLATPNKRPDQFTGGSGSARRWLRTHIFSRSEDDVFEAFMQSPSKRYSTHQTAEFDIRVQKLYVNGDPSISSSPPPFYHVEHDVNNTWFEE